MTADGRWITYCYTYVGHQHYNSAPLYGFASSTYELHSTVNFILNIIIYIYIIELRSPRHWQSYWADDVHFGMFVSADTTSRDGISGGHGDGHVVGSTDFILNE